MMNSSIEDYNELCASYGASLRDVFKLYESGHGWVSAFYNPQNIIARRHYLIEINANEKNTQGRMPYSELIRINKKCTEPLEKLVQSISFTPVNVFVNRKDQKDYMKRNPTARLVHSHINIFTDVVDTTISMIDKNNNLHVMDNDKGIIAECAVNKLAKAYSYTKEAGGFFAARESLRQTEIEQKYNFKQSLAYKVLKHAI